MIKKKKAIALYSGGLDSILAIKLITRQNIDVIGLILETPFIENKQSDHGEEFLGIPIIKKDMTEDFQKILIHPIHGYGKNVNPCIDCRILMFRKAGEVMEQEQADFIISGEVLGQRPMTQNKKSLLKISDESSYGKWIVRPLSALLLPETEPEKQKIIDRSMLLDIQGRSRKRQIELAERWGLKKYPAPAGGCKLTEPGFAKRIDHLLKLTKQTPPTQNDINLLKVGRHFVLNEYTKLIIGRNEKENNKIFPLARPGDYLLSSPGHKGPLALLRFYLDPKKEYLKLDETLNLAAGITARYCDKDDGTDLIDIHIFTPDKKISQTKYRQSLSEQEIEHYRI